MTELVPPAEANQPAPLIAPEAVEVIPADQAGQMVKLSAKTISILNQKVEDFLGSIVKLSPQSPDFSEKVNTIDNLARDEIRAAAAVSNRFLEKPVSSMKDGAFDNGSDISRSLLDLRRTVESLDPARQGNLFGQNKFLGLIPFGNKIQDYFQKYQSSQSHINAIITGLYNGQDELRKDNAAIEQEKINMWDLMQQLQQYIYVGKELDKRVSAKVAELEVADPDRARIVREDMLFAVRQKLQDLLTQQAVNIQGYLAMDMIKKNNSELIKGVDRATTTTVSALRTAVITAQALTNQKLVLDQINALNTTTSSLIESTSEMLKQQTVDIHRQASNSTVKIESLQKAFGNIYQSLDMISTFKSEALNNMQQTVNSLNGEIKKAQLYLDRTRKEEALREGKEPELLSSGEPQQALPKSNGPVINL